MFEQIRDFFFEYAPWLIFMPWLLALKNMSTYPPALKTIFHYLTIAVCTHLVSFTLWKMKIPNLYILHIYTLAEYLILLRYYFLLLKGFIPAYVFYFLAIAFPLFAITDSLVIETLHSFNTYSRSVEALVFIFLSVSWFVKAVSDTENNETNKQPLNYIAGGLLIYFAGSIILFSFLDMINEFVFRFMMNVWSIHTFLLVILYILITIGLWKHSKK
jgi:hypothetical protein